MLQRKRHQIVNGLLAGRLMHHRGNAPGGLHQPALFGGKIQRLVMVDLRTTAFDRCPRERSLLPHMAEKPRFGQSRGQQGGVHEAHVLTSARRTSHERWQVFTEGERTTALDDERERSVGGITHEAPGHFG